MDFLLVLLSRRNFTATFPDCGLFPLAARFADQYLLMERCEFIKRGAGADMDQDGVRELLSV